MLTWWRGYRHQLECAWAAAGLASGCPGSKGCQRPPGGHRPPGGRPPTAEELLLPRGTCHGHSQASDPGKLQKSQTLLLAGHERLCVVVSLCRCQLGVSQHIARARWRRAVTGIKAAGGPSAHHSVQSSALPSSQQHPSKCQPALPPVLASRHDAPRDPAAPHSGHRRRGPGRAQVPCWFQELRHPKWPRRQ